MLIEFNNCLTIVENYMFHVKHVNNEKGKTDPNLHKFNEKKVKKDCNSSSI